MANETSEIIDLTDIIEQGKTPKDNELFEENLDKIEGLDDPSLDELLSSIDNKATSINLDDDFDSAIDSSNTPDEADELDELDALLASTPSSAPKTKVQDEDNLFSELDDLLSETPVSPQKASVNDISLDDLDELLGSAEKSVESKKDNASPAVAPQVNKDISELDKHSAPKTKPSISPAEPKTDPKIEPKTEAKIKLEINPELELDFDDLDTLLNNEQIPASKPDQAKVQTVQNDDFDILTIAKPEEELKLTSPTIDPRIDELFAKLEAQEQIISELKAELDAFKLAKNAEELEKEIENTENNNTEQLIADLSAELAADLTNLEDKFELYKTTSLTQIEALNTQNANLSADLQRLSKAQANFELSIEQTVAHAAAQIIQEEIAAILNEEE